MDPFFRFLAISATWLLLQLRCLGLAAGHHTCPRSEAISTIFSSDGFSHEGLQAAERKFHLMDHDESAREALLSLEAKVHRLERTIDDLQKRLKRQITHTTPLEIPPASRPAVGDAQELLFAVREMRFASEASFVELVSLTRKRNESFSMALSSVLMVVCSRDGVLEARSLADPSNSVILKTGHQAQVLSLTIFPRGDDVSVLTTDEAGIAFLHELSVHRDDLIPKAVGPGSPDTPTPGQLVINPLVLSLEPSESFRVSPGGTKKHNCVLSATVKGERLVFVGDSDGFISVFSRSGSLKAKLKVTNEQGGILHLAHFGGLTVFASRTCVGNVNPMGTGASGKVSCLGMSASIASMALDARRIGRGAVALEDGQVLYLDVKTWTLLHKFPKLLEGPAKLLFAKEKLFAVTLSDKAQHENVSKTSPKSEIVIFDLLAVERPESAHGPVVRFLPLDISAGTFALLRRTGDTSILAVASEDEGFVQVFECLHHDQPALSDESWSHLRLPIMLVTILVAVGVQVYRTRNMSKPSEAPTGDAANVAELDALWKERLRNEQNVYRPDYRSYLEQSPCPSLAMTDLDN